MPDLLRGIKINGLLTWKIKKMVGNPFKIPLSPVMGKMYVVVYVVVVKKVIFLWRVRIGKMV
jgi:hypothetical protein